MSKKDYELLAETIQTFQWNSKEQHQDYAVHLAYFLQVNNPNFNRAAFYKAVLPG